MHLDWIKYCLSLQNNKKVVFLADLSVWVSRNTEKKKSVLQNKHVCTLLLLIHTKNISNTALGWTGSMN